MTRTSYRPIAVVGLVVCLFTYIGCYHEDESKNRSTPAAPTEGKAKPADSGKLFADWSPEPTGVLLISGEQDGYLEPCGCTQGQMGGLLRRYDLIERIKRDRKWPVALIDLGSLIKDPAGARGGFEEAKIKFGTALKALDLLNYNALGLSAEDLKLGVFETLGQYAGNLGETTKVVAANVAAPDFDKLIVPSVRASVGSVKVGITAVLAPEAVNAMSDSDKSMLKVKAIQEALPGVLADLEKDTRVQILMVQGPPELAKELAEANPGFEIVVGTSQVADPAEDPEMLNDGKTMLVNVGKRGKYIGAVGIFPDAKQLLRYRRQTLIPRFDGPATPMKELIQDGYRQALKDQKVVENFVRRDYVGADGATYVGAETCKTCHPNTFAKWASTKHAHAFQSLLDDPKPNTQFDADCVTCHTTGFEYNSGWKSAEATPYLKGNQCENCHGPGSKHVASPDDQTVRKAIALTAEGAQKNHFCLRCHDEDNSPKFDFVTYYGKIAHKGLDTYSDPKVHKGQAVTHGK